MGYREVLESQLNGIVERIAAFDALPAEPLTAASPTVIHFELRFADQYTSERTYGSKTYTYAAVRCDFDGKWYTTGPRSPKGYTWAELVKWMMLDNHVVGDVWLAIGWETI